MQNRSLFNGGRRLTATQAKGFGLIEDVFLPDNFEKEVVFRTCELAAKFPQVNLLFYSYDTDYGFYGLQTP
jgi:1,4-dihydroxy-2-naphthoyl-CoA synthase